MCPLNPFGLKLGTCGDGGTEAGSKGTFVVTADILGLMDVSIIERKKKKRKAYSEVSNKQRVERWVLTLDSLGGSSRIVG